MKKKTKIWAFEQSVLHDRIFCILIPDAQSHPSPSRSHAPDSMGGAVPERYYVVTNSEAVQIKYLLIFVDKKISQR